MTEQNSITAVDSLIANEFEVEVNGERVHGVFRITGLTTFRLDAEGGGEASMERIFPPFQLAKMVQRDPNSVFNKWLRETVTTAPGHTRPRRTIVLKAVDDGVETRRWTFNGAWISEVAYAPFDSGSSQMIEEMATIQYDSIDETWPAGSDS
ncbi:MAG: hypothetical protein OHK0046_35370 [Anaerolineae bacterium]